MPRERWYFAYGSNMDSESVRRRGIEVAESARAALSGYRLAFDLGAVLFSQEPRMANLREDPDATVHGVAHRIAEADLRRLDGLEFTYDRIDVDLAFYEGGRAPGCTYVVTNPEFLEPEAPPSQRYLQILRHGAREHDLAESFCAWLDAHPAHVMPPDPGVPAALTALVDPREYTVPELAALGADGRPHLAGFGGYVFDFEGVDNPVAHAFLTGHDGTVHLIGRLLSHPTPLTPADMHPDHWAWMNHALHDLVRVGRVVGVLRGGLAQALRAGAGWHGIKA